MKDADLYSKTVFLHHAINLLGKDRVVVEDYFGKKDEYVCKIGDVVFLEQKYKIPTGNYNPFDGKEIVETMTFYVAFEDDKEYEKYEFPVGRNYTKALFSMNKLSHLFDFLVKNRGHLIRCPCCGDRLEFFSHCKTCTERYDNIPNNITAKERERLLDRNRWNLNSID